MWAARLATFLLVLLVAACTAIVDVHNGKRVVDATFSFETDMAGWTPRGTDLQLGSGNIDWSIAQTQELAHDGMTSLKLSINNLNDQGKIWIEKPFTLQPNKRYHVQVRYAFATSDAMVNAFRIIAGALPKSPQTRDDLASAYQDSTFSGGSSSSYVWLDKWYAFDVLTDSTGTLHIVIGVWGTFEAWRIYYVDSVRITIDEQ